MILIDDNRFNNSCTISELVEVGIIFLMIVDPIILHTTAKCVQVEFYDVTIKKSKSIVLFDYCIQLSHININK